MAYKFSTRKLGNPRRLGRACETQHATPNPPQHPISARWVTVAA